METSKNNPEKMIVGNTSAKTSVKETAKKKVRNVKKEKSVKADKTKDGKVIEKTLAKKKKAVKKRAVKKGKAKKSKKKAIVVAEVVKPINKATKLKRWMKERDINQKVLAKKTSCSTNTINRLIKNGHASMVVIKVVSNELGITVEQLQQLLKFEEPINI